MRSLTATAQARIASPSLDLVRLVQITDGTTTWYLCDRADATLIEGQPYDPRVLSYQEIQNGALNTRDMTFTATQCVITLDNIGDLFNGEDPTSYEVAIYELYQPGAMADALKVFGGQVERVEAISVKEIRLLVGGNDMVVAKRFSHTIANRDDYPSLDPDDIGKMLTVVYGDASKVPFINVEAGCMTFLVDLVSDTAGAGTVFEVNSTICFYNASGGSSFLAQIDEEQFTLGFDGELWDTHFYIIARGVNGTDVAKHAKGAIVFMVLTSYQYIIDHPVNAINNVYVGGLKVVSDVNVYTGLTGDEHPSHPGRACIEFETMPIISRQVEIEIEDTIDVEDELNVNDTIAVGDNINYATNSLIQLKQQPTGGPVNGRDGNEDTYEGALTSGGKTWTFLTTDFGTIQQVVIYVTLSTSTTGAGNDTVTLDYSGGSTNITVPHDSSSRATLRRYKITITGSLDWDDEVVLKEATNAVGVHEVDREVTYAPTLAKTGSAYKTGDVDRSGSVYKSGTVTGGVNSAADTVVGGQVSADVEGYLDTDGSITGTSGTLIERPDHIAKHILVERCDMPSSIVNSTAYAAAGADYNSQSIDLAVVITEKPDTKALLHEIAFQAQSLQWWEGGAHNLKYWDYFSDPIDKIISAEHINFDGLLLSYTSRDEIQTKIIAQYNVDWIRINDVGGPVGSVTVEDEDQQDIFGILERQKTLFQYVRTEAIATAVVENFLKWISRTKLTIDITGSYYLIDLEIGDMVSFDFETDDYLDQQLLGRVATTDRFRVISKIVMNNGTVKLTVCQEIYIIELPLPP